jgi:putative restriction endonuclease
MKAYLGITDSDWIATLGVGGPEVAQANFWNPGGTRSFRALQHGEVFLFKTHSARGDGIVGGGVFDAFVFMRVDEAWETFGLANGVSSIDEFLTRVGKYRRSSDPLTPATQVGCTLLRDVRFFDPVETQPRPADFSTNIVQGRTYDLDELDAQHPVLIAAAHLAMPGVVAPGAPVPLDAQQRMFGDARLQTVRLGQDAFKAVIAHNYGYHCAITGDKVRPVLEAAHIVPVAAGGQHRPDNGLLLRSDMHTLYDRGYIGIDERYRLRVSPLLRAEFGNGDALYAKSGESIETPSRRSDKPAREFLQWHMETVFKQSA